VRRERVNELRKAGFVLEHGGDVVKKYSRLGKIGHRADQRLQSFYIDWLVFFGHTSIIEASGQLSEIRDQKKPEAPAQHLLG
jgi:hypothetical protein